MDDLKTGAAALPDSGLYKTPAPAIMLITKLVSLTGLTKLPVADCLKCRFCFGLQLQRIGVGRCSPRLSVWTLCEVKGVEIHISQLDEQMQPQKNR